MRLICEFLVMFLLPIVLSRSLGNYDARNEVADSDYEADTRVAQDQAERKDSDHETQERGAREQQPLDTSQYQIVDYGGNTFLQRMPGSSAAVVAEPLSREQPVEGDSASASYGEKVAPSSPKEKYVGLGTTYNDRVNSKNIPLESTNIEDEAHDKDEESLSPPSNVNYRRLSRARRIFSSEPRSERAKQYCAKHSDKKSGLVGSEQNDLEENGRINRGNIYHDHHSENQGFEKGNEHSANTDYASAEYLSENYGAKDNKPLHKENINAYENDNAEALDYEESSNVEGFRDRRDTKETLADSKDTAVKQPTPSCQETHDDSNKSDEASMEEKEQQAIKRHIASLSGDQMNELLKSLSPDKRELLQEIIDSDKTSKTENKREVTKKDGVIEANNVNDNNPSESNKVNILESSLDKSLKTPLASESDVKYDDKNMKEAVVTNENIEFSNRDSENNGESKNEQNTALANADSNKPDVANKESNLSKDQESDKPDELLKKESTSKESEQSNLREISSDNNKADIKREIRLNDYEVNDQYDNSENVNMNSDLTDDTVNDSAYIETEKEATSSDNDHSELSHETFQPSKRTLEDKQSKVQSSYSDHMKALGDSFPSARSYDEMSYQKFAMSPLVRVKRNKRDTYVKKRSALVPDAKAAYLPYRADTEDEDDDEGNEFEDDGFFDRTSNLAKGHHSSLSVDGDALKIVQSNVKTESENQNKIMKNAEDASGTFTNGEVQEFLQQIPENSNAKDSSKLGSDTDNVLSGAEGADENLMLTSGTRLSREIDKDVNVSDGNGANKEFEDGKRMAAEELESTQNDQSGAFGGLPKAYDGELSRFKRIRSVNHCTGK